VALGRWRTSAGDRLDQHKKFLETGDAAASQGWTAYVLDTKRQRQARRLCRAQPTGRSLKDKRVLAGMYGIGVDPNDGSIWGSVLGDAGAACRASFRATIRPRRHSPNITRCPTTIRARL